jgi:uncharacterized protein
MKYLIVVLVVLVLGWLLLRGRSRPETDARAASRETQPQEVVACRHCGLHLPRIDAIEDHNGVFCSEAHRLASARYP